MLINGIIKAIMLLKIKLVYDLCNKIYLMFMSSCVNII